MPLPVLRPTPTGGGGGTPAKSRQVIHFSSIEEYGSSPLDTIGQFTLTNSTLALNITQALQLSYASGDAGDLVETVAASYYPVSGYASSTATGAEFWIHKDHGVSGLTMSRIGPVYTQGLLSVADASLVPLSGVTVTEAFNDQYGHTWEAFATGTTSVAMSNDHPYGSGTSVNFSYTSGVSNYSAPGGSASPSKLLPNNYTMEAWVKVAAGSADCELLSLGLVNVNSYTGVLRLKYLSSGTTVQLQQFDTASSSWTTSTLSAVIATDTWVHIGLQRDVDYDTGTYLSGGDYLRLIVGSAVSSSIIPTSIASGIGTPQVTIGATSTITSTSSFKISQFRFSSGVRYGNTAYPGELTSRFVPDQVIFHIGRMEMLAVSPASYATPRPSTTKIHRHYLAYGRLGLANYAVQVTGVEQTRLGSLTGTFIRNRFLNQPYSIEAYYRLKSSPTQRFPLSSDGTGIPMYVDRPPIGVAINGANLDHLMSVTGTSLSVTNDLFVELILRRTF